MAKEINGQCTVYKNTGFNKKFSKKSSKEYLRGSNLGS